MRSSATRGSGSAAMPYRPWRTDQAEAVVAGKPLTEANAEAAAAVALSGAVTQGHNDYKPELGRRALVRALMEAKTMPVETGKDC